MAASPTHRPSPGRREEGIRVPKALASSVAVRSWRLRCRAARTLGRPDPRRNLYGREVVEREALFRGEYGRLRDVLVGPRGEVYLTTSNRDGRGRPASDDDRILRILP